MAWVRQLERLWEDGDAVLPIDHRLPSVARDQLLATMAPAEIIEISENGTITSNKCHNGRPVSPGDALVMATSGTTGHPKGVILTHQAVKASALATSKRLNVDVEVDRWLACLPFSHVGGLSVVTRALHTNTALTVHAGFDATAAMSAATQGANLVSLVATALGRVDPSVFKRIVLGGSTPPTNLPDNVVTTYGMTETGSGVVYDGLPLDGVEIRVVDQEIQLRAPMMLRGYRDGTHPFTNDGWLKTGDQGDLDTATGRLSVTGRSSELIITGGENVWPTPVETRLEAHPAVREAAVFGEPDPEWGEKLVALVVWETGHSPVSLAEIRGFVKEALPTYCAPKELRSVAALPRTAIGKLARHSLPSRSN